MKKGPTPAAHPPHVEIKFDSVSTTIKYDHGAKVVWKATKHPKKMGRDNTAYNVTITRGSVGPLPFSLFTLAIQAIDFDVLVKNPSKTRKVTLIRRKGPPISLDASGHPIDSAGKLANGDVDPDGIWFIDFTGGRCTLSVEAVNRIKLGETVWIGPRPRNQHDNMPPGGTTEK